MSRLIKEPIQLPKGVEVKVAGQKIDVKGPKGTLHVEVMEHVLVTVKGQEVFISPDEKLQHIPFLGLSRGLIVNAIHGVVSGYEKKLELVGVGYKAAVKGHNIDLSLGFSHPCQLEIPKGITVTIEKNTLITMTGIDKQLLGQFAASVRALKKPEPYKGKGIKYANEVIRRKAGKTAK